MIITILDFCLTTMAIFIKLEAQKALYSLYKQILILIFQLKLSDALVYPILTYSAEIWGFENKNIIEEIHLQFCKTILGVTTSTPNFLVYGKIGRYPIELQIKIKMLYFWNKIVGNPDEDIL